MRGALLHRAPVGFLIGEGCPAGDTTALPETIDQVIALLTRPARCARALEQALARLEALIGPANIPTPRTELESDLFDALTIIFLEPRLSERARNAVRRAFGEQTFETLTAYLAFIRTAHYWTETHPELAYEPEIAAVMQRYPDLAALLLDQTEAKRVAEGEALRQALPARVLQISQRVSQGRIWLNSVGARCDIATDLDRDANHISLGGRITQIGSGLIWVGLLLVTNSRPQKWARPSDAYSPTTYDCGTVIQVPSISIRTTGSPPTIVSTKSSAGLQSCWLQHDWP